LISKGGRVVRDFVGRVLEREEGKFDAISGSDSDSEEEEEEEDSLDSASSVGASTCHHILSASLV